MKVISRIFMKWIQKSHAPLEFTAKWLVIAKYAASANSITVSRVNGNGLRSFARNSAIRVAPPK